MGSVGLFYTGEGLVHYLVWAALKQFSEGNLGGFSIPQELSLPRKGWNGMRFSRKLWILWKSLCFWKGACVLHKKIK